MALGIISLIGLGASLLGASAQKKEQEAQQATIEAEKAKQAQIIKDTRPEEVGASFAAGAKRDTSTAGTNAFLSPLSIG